MQMDLECFFFIHTSFKQSNRKSFYSFTIVFLPPIRVLYAECSFYIFGTLFSAQVLLFDTTEMPVALNCTLRTCCILLRSLSKCKFSHSPIVYTWILLTHTESIYGAVCNLAVCADFVSYLCCVYAYGHGM